MKRRTARLLPWSGIACAAWFAVVIGLLSLAPHLSLRAGLAADGVAALAGGAWCGLNFWLCHDAHCAVTGTGWLALSVLAFAGAGAGHSLISGYEQPALLAVLAAALGFEAVWRLASGTNALGRSTAPGHSSRLRRAKKTDVSPLGSKGLPAGV